MHVPAGGTSGIATAGASVWLTEIPQNIWAMRSSGTNVLPPNSPGFDASYTPSSSSTNGCG